MSIKSVYLFGCLFFIKSFAFSQVFIENLLMDPSRNEEKELKSQNLRIEENVSPLPPLQLPFFEDFTQVNPSIDTIYNNLGDTVKIFTMGYHGFEKAVVYIFNVSASSDAAAEKVNFINGTWYAKKVNNYSFQLFEDPAYTKPLLGKGGSIKGDSIERNKSGRYYHPGRKIGPGPDTLKWESNSNVYINNNYSISPPSLFVATFDGLKRNGEPYSNNQDAISWADFLTSRPIDLSNIMVTSKDSVYFSFWWQAGGLGDLPDSFDSLKLEFLNSAELWEPIKTIFMGENGVPKFDEKKFIYELIKLDSKFFHSKFRFRFRNFGRLNGLRDLWHIDYIYLNTGRSPQNPNTLDQTISSVSNKIFKDYHSIPVKHFNLQETNLFSDGFTVNVRNLTDNLQAATFTNSFIKDIKNNNILSNINGFGTVPANSVVQVNLPMGSFPFPVEDSTIQIKVHIEGQLSDNKNKTIDYTVNNLDSVFVFMSNYYAKDDGVGEQGWGLNLKNAQAVSKFDILADDQLTELQFNFPIVNGTFGPNTDIILKVFPALSDGFPSTVSLDDGKQTCSVSPNLNNKFTICKFKNPISLKKGTYFFGYQQTTMDEQYFFVGLDLNTYSPGSIFLRERNFHPWIQDTKNFGNLLIRPVFGSNNAVGILKSSFEELTCDIFPNPTNGEINILGEVKHAKLYDVSGKLLDEKAYSSTEAEKSFDASHFNPGFYFLHLENGERKAIKKVIIAR